MSSSSPKDGDLLPKLDPSLVYAKKSDPPKSSISLAEFSPVVSNPRTLSSSSASSSFNNNNSSSVSQLWVECAKCSQTLSMVRELKSHCQAEHREASDDVLNRSIAKQGLISCRLCGVFRERTIDAVFAHCWERHRVSIFQYRKSFPDLAFEQSHADEVASMAAMRVSCPECPSPTNAGQFFAGVKQWVAHHRSKHSSPNSEESKNSSLDQMLGLVADQLGCGVAVRCGGCLAAVAADMMQKHKEHCQGRDADPTQIENEGGSGGSQVKLARKAPSLINENAGSRQKDKNEKNGLHVRCPNCHQKFAYLIQLNKHIDTEHAESDVEALKQRAVEDAGIFSCRLCFTVRQKIKDQFRPHLHNCHKMKPEEYQARFGDDAFAQSVSDRNISRVINQLRCPKRDTCRHSETMSLAETRQHLAESHGMGEVRSDTVICQVSAQLGLDRCARCLQAVSPEANMMARHLDTCREVSAVGKARAEAKKSQPEGPRVSATSLSIHCSLCQDSSNTLGDFHRHTETKHPEDSKFLNDRAIETAGILTCRLCFTVEIRSGTFIAQHVAAHHKISGKQYRERFGPRSFCQSETEKNISKGLNSLRCPFGTSCTKNAMSYLELTDHLSTTHRQGHVKSAMLLSQVAEQLGLLACDSCKLIVSPKEGMMDKHRTVCRVNNALSPRTEKRIEATRSERRELPADGKRKRGRPRKNPRPEEDPAKRTPVVNVSPAKRTPVVNVDPVKRTPVVNVSPVKRHPVVNVAPTKRTPVVNVAVQPVENGTDALKISCPCCSELSSTGLALRTHLKDKHAKYNLSEDTLQRLVEAKGVVSCRVCHVARRANHADFTKHVWGLHGMSLEEYVREAAAKGHPRPFAKNAREKTATERLGDLECPRCTEKGIRGLESFRLHLHSRHNITQSGSVAAIIGEVAEQLGFAKCEKCKMAVEPGALEEHEEMVHSQKSVEGRRRRRKRGAKKRRAGVEEASATRRKSKRGRPRKNYAENKDDDCNEEEEEEETLDIDTVENSTSDQGNSPAAPKANAPKEKVSRVESEKTAVHIEIPSLASIKSEQHGDNEARSSNDLLSAATANDSLTGKVLKLRLLHLMPKCPFCPHRSKSMEKLGMHVRSTHISDYAHWVVRAFKKVAKLVCGMCSTEMVADYDSLEAHLKEAHAAKSMDCIDYLTEFGVALAGQRRIKHDLLMKQCVWCGEGFKSVTLLKAHAEARHKGCFDAEIVEMTEAVSCQAKHRCRLCDTQVRMDYACAEAHVRGKHSLDIERYLELCYDDVKLDWARQTKSEKSNGDKRSEEEIVVLNDEDEASTRINKAIPETAYVSDSNAKATSVNGSTETSDGVEVVCLSDEEDDDEVRVEKVVDDDLERRRNNPYLASAGSAVGSSFTGPSSVVSRRLSTTSTARPPPQENGCTYTCPKCKIGGFASLLLATMHIDRIHGGDIEILAALKASRVEKRTECKICGREVVRDNVDLGYHLWSEHSLPLEAYSKL